MKDQETAWIRLLPSLLVVLHLTLAYVLTWSIPLPLAVPPVLRLGGLLLTIIGFLLGVLALSSFRRTRQTVQKRGGAGLITSGVYGYSRNPVYLGFVLMLAGILFNAGSYWGLILVPVMMFVFNRLIIQPEEEFLTRKFGKDYTTYQSRVRRWI